MQTEREMYANSCKFICKSAHTISPLARSQCLCAGGTEQGLIGWGQGKCCGPSCQDPQPWDGDSCTRAVFLFSCCPFLPPALPASPPSVQGHMGKLEDRNKAGTDTCSSVCWPSSFFLQWFYLWVNSNLHFGFSKPCSEVSVFVVSHSCFLIL